MWDVKKEDLFLNYFHSKQAFDQGIHKAILRAIQNCDKYCTYSLNRSNLDLPE